MAALTCEICGGKLIGKPGGLFECDSCGMEYNTEWAKAKIQEIKGTVQVEGTVEVTGKVQIDGPVKVEGGGPTIEGMLFRASQISAEVFALADKHLSYDKRQEKKKEAKALYNNVLLIDPLNREAYLGLCRIDLERDCPTEQEVVAYYVETRRGGKNPTFQTALVNVPSLKQEYDRYLKEQKVRHEQNKREFPAIRERIRPAQGLIYAGNGDWFGVRADGTVVMGGAKTSRYREVPKWRNIVYLTGSAWDELIVGVRTDGSVVVDGPDGCPDSFRIAENWQDVVAVTVSRTILAGLKADGKVVLALKNAYRHDAEEYESECKVLREAEQWSDIVSIDAGDGYLDGLRKNGKVLTVGKYAASHRASLSRLDDIVDVNEGVILRRDGRAYYGLYITDCLPLENIVAISGHSWCAVGLKSDGTVVAVGDNSSGRCNVTDWTDIVAISAGGGYTLGLKSDGTVVATGRLKVRNWKLFNSLDTLEEERRNAMDALNEQERQAAEKVQAESNARRRKHLESERETLQTELSNLKGLFTGKRKKELEAQLAKIDAELKTLL